MADVPRVLQVQPGTQGLMNQRLESFFDGNACAAAMHEFSSKFRGLCRIGPVHDFFAIAVDRPKVRRQQLLPDFSQAGKLVGRPGGIDERHVGGFIGKGRESFSGHNSSGLIVVSPKKTPDPFVTTCRHQR